jgi:hypothetical protein
VKKNLRQIPTHVTAELKKLGRSVVAACALPLSIDELGLIGFRGHLTKGVYGVRHARREEAAAAA